MIGAVILCRHDSQRLPGKILRELHGRVVLDIIVQRLSAALPSEAILVATSEDSSDDPIVTHCNQKQIAFYRGSKHDVASRFLAAGKSANWEYLVRVNGDNPLGDHGALLHLLNVAESGQYDFLTNVPGRTFGRGLSLEIIRTQVFEKAYPDFSPEDMEHVMTYFYPRGARFRTYTLHCDPPVPNEIHFALDTHQDLANLEELLGRIPVDPKLHSANTLADAYKRRNDGI